MPECGPDACTPALCFVTAGSRLSRPAACVPSLQSTVMPTAFDNGTVPPAFCPHGHEEVLLVGMRRDVPYLRRVRERAPTHQLLIVLVVLQQPYLRGADPGVGGVGWGGEAGSA